MQSWQDGSMVVMSEFVNFFSLYGGQLMIVDLLTSDFIQYYSWFVVYDWWLMIVNQSEFIQLLFELNSLAHHIAYSNDCDDMALFILWSIL